MASCSLKILCSRLEEFHVNRITRVLDCLVFLPSFLIWLVPNVIHFEYSSLLEFNCFTLQEQKRLQEQFAAEQESLYGSRPAVKKPLPLSQSTNANTMAGTPTGRRSGLGTPSGGRHGISGPKDHRRDSGKIGAAAIPLNYVAIPK